jgi:hypothetical protein
LFTPLVGIKLHVGFMPGPDTGASFAPPKRPAMQALIRKYSTGLLTIVIYAIIIAFSVIVSLDLI